MRQQAGKGKNQDMATYHLSAKIGSKGKGCAHSDYIERVGKNAKHKDLEHAENGNLPDWANGKSSTFWKAADEFERENGSVYRELEVALPRELTPDQRLELVREFVANEIGNKHAYSFAIHCPTAALDPAKGEQPHAHIMYSERLIDGIERPKEQYFKRYNAKKPELGGLKKASGGKHMTAVKEELKDLRERWATLQNSHLARRGHSAQVDHRTLEAQGIERDPRKHLTHLGVTAISIMKKQQVSTRRNMLHERFKGLRAEHDKRKEQPAIIEEQPKPKAEAQQITPMEAFRTMQASLPKLEKQRRQRVLEVSARIEAQASKRGERSNRWMDAKPKPPEGLFEAFKRKKYETDVEVWAKPAKRAYALHGRALNRLRNVDKQSLPTVLKKWAVDAFAKQFPSIYALALEGQKQYEEWKKSEERSKPPVVNEKPKAEPVQKLVEIERPKENREPPKPKTPGMGR